MKIIKLDAIDSTNTFLKEMAGNSILENFTVVVAKHQRLGRGQMKTEWNSKEGKNLTFSVFVKFKGLLVTSQRYLNFSVAISVYEVLNELKLPKMSIKWPNDILAEGMKICGILIENSLKGNEIQSSVIGVGLNVNESFLSNKELKAVSIKDILKEELGLDDLLKKVVVRLEKNIEILNAKEYDYLESKYLDVLYKKNVPSMFKTNQNVLFMGKIVGVSKNGKLQIELSDETIKEFEIKEVSFA
ncbi:MULTISPECIES: biotin--[acetyl-CoA-carboxylase] ligase [Tenacibaculum]|uniref:biotin--[acetyl-CoA-carboxylase] ligase n=1 Tax=Tenacibaculum TaxID=104267 RepID=UPI00089CDE5B|nr:biotin--[acetyl-CoA-carboxylase] ligase [Tenacibaculum sp. MAR_2010_89]SEE36835.1 BirA family transcriptional regulator, biotin operon repressor / biotin-[acetyl-CoA-carboxylase] ligase [Tenacibaculum sp. MAR_2010_89]